MATKLDIKTTHEFELAISYLIDAPPEKVFRAWTDGSTYPEWFCPKPWSVSKATLDVRPGGNSNVVMRSPEGQEFPNPGVYLEVIPNKKLVFTNVFSEAWIPASAAHPTMTAVLTFEDQGGKTKYTARSFHASKEKMEEHRKMGFHEGWGICTQQLEAYLKRL